MKPAAIAAIVLGLALGACFGGDDYAVQGRVSSTDDSRVPVDGPAVIVLRDSFGAEHTVHVTPWPCVAQDLAPLGTIAVGDVVAVRGTVDADGAISPCDEPDHFLRIVATDR